MRQHTTFDNAIMTNEQQELLNNPAFAALIQQTIQQAVQGAFIERYEGEHILFTDFAKEWFDYKALTLSQGTQERNLILYQNNIKPYFKGKTLCQITVPVLQELMNRMSETHKPSTMKTLKSIVGQIMTYADSRDLIKKNPVPFVSIPRGEEDHKRALTEDEIKALIKASHTNRLWIVPYLLLGTGMRRSEMLGLTWNDIDFEKQEIYVNKGYVKTPKSKHLLNKPKTKSSERRIAIDNKLVCILKHYKERHGTGRTFVIGLTKKDAMMAPKTFDDILCRWCKNAGIEKITSHYFRHTYATMASDLGQQLLTIARQLGHVGTRMCETRYVHHTSNKAQQECANTVGNKIFGLTNLC